MALLDNILRHAEDEFPKESCGLVVIYKGREIYHPCRNVADSPTTEFVIHPEDYAIAEDMGNIVKVVHSHPITNASPSQPDLVSIESSNLPWLIVNPKTGQVTETYPSGYKAPLIGRQYAYGILDCFSIVRDYYKENLGIDIPDKEREGHWWDNGKNLFLDFYEAYGFKKVDSLKKHDIVLMYNGAKTPNHLGVYLGDGKMLHHVQGRLSSRDVYGNSGFWFKNTWGYIRHVDLFDTPC